MTWVLGGVGDELAGLGLGDGSAGRRHERMAGVLHGVLEVRRVDVDLVSGDGSDELLLEVEGGDGAAGEVVVEAAGTSWQANRGWWRCGGTAVEPVPVMSCLAVWRA